MSCGRITLLKKIKADYIFTVKSGYYPGNEIKKKMVKFIILPRAYEHSRAG